METSLRPCFGLPACALAAALLLAGCGAGDDAERPPPETDPAIAAALDYPLMTDPDLVGLNEAASVASLPAPMDGIPTIDGGPDAITAARQDAVELLGGTGALQKAPPADEQLDPLPGDAVLTAGTRAAAAPSISADCADRVTYTARWAARMPQKFPVYPRAAVQEAAGTDAGGCDLRVANFITPVPLSDVVDFYFTRASQAGYEAKHAMQGGDNVLGGARGGASFVVYLRQLPGGMTEVDLLTSGR